MQERPMVSFNVALLTADIARRGWLPIDLARRAKVSHMSVGRFLRGERQTPRMAKKLASALGQSLERYVVTDARVSA